jgi:hypothetical protein
MYSSIEDFNELTLNLMTNKVYYNEYLEKTNPIKFNELQEYKRKFNKYSNKMLNMTKELFENPDKVFNTETTEIFVEYTKVCIRYLEMKEVEKSNENSSEFQYDHGNDDYDDDVLFAENKMENTSVPDINWSSHRVKKMSNSKI